MLHQVNEVLQILTATVVGLVFLLLARHSKRGQHTWTGIGFTLCILCYVIVESDAIQSFPVARYVVMTGAISIPLFFWLLSRAIFEDHFKVGPGIIGWLLVQLVPHFAFFLFDLKLWSGFEPLSSIITGSISLGFVLAGLYTALKTKQNDLVESRIKFRNVFITITASLIGITLIVEAIPIDRQTILILQVLQRLTIFGITLYFLVFNFEIRSGFFFREIREPKSKPIRDSLMSMKLQTLMEEQKVYRKEGLTIRELADMLSEQEYKVRRLINGELGFRNFNDFLNKYRVNDACQILSDESQNRKTILEIAYSLGYQSIGPFNKAFKELKNATPTAFRKTSQA